MRRKSNSLVPPMKNHELGLEHDIPVDLNRLALIRLQSTEASCKNREPVSLNCGSAPNTLAGGGRKYRRGAQGLTAG